MIANLKFYINNKEVIPPFEYEELEFTARFPESSAAANIETSDILFVDTDTVDPKQRPVKVLTERMFSGLNGGVGYFEGIPFKVELTDENNNVNAFDGYLKDYQIINPVQMQVVAQKTNGLDTLEKRLQGITAQGLLNEGFYTGADYVDVKTVLEEKIQDALLKAAMAAITIYSLVKEIQETIKRTSKDVAEITTHSSGGQTGPVAAALYAIALIILNGVYVAAMVIIIINMLDVIYQALLPPVVTDKAITYRTLISKPLEKLGYKLESNIEGLDWVYYPSKTGNNQGTFTDIIAKYRGRKIGIPNNTDFGYFGNDALNLILTKFKAKINIDGDTVNIYNDLDPFWQRNSTFQLKDYLDEAYDVNREELFANQIVSYDYDITDFWTIENFTGTNVEIITEPKTFENEQMITIEGLQQTRIPLALGNRKDKLNGVEKALIAIAEPADEILSLFGSSKSFADLIKARQGVLKKQDWNHAVAKSLVVENGYIVPNHRSINSAKAIYDKYHTSSSFVRADEDGNQYIGQKRMYRNRILENFTFSDFLSLIENSYFTLNGAQAKFEEIVYNPTKDTATATYWVREVYTKNLKETVIEP